MTTLRLSDQSLIVSTTILAVTTLASCNINHEQLDMFHMSQRIVTSSVTNTHTADFYVFRIISGVLPQTCAEECMARKRCSAVNVPMGFNICYLIAKSSQSSAQQEIEDDVNSIYGIKHEWPESMIQKHTACNCPDDGQTCVLGGQCEFRECGLPEDKTNATYLGNVFAVSTRIAYKCQGSLKINLKRESSNVALCMENGTWSATDFTCDACRDGYYGTNCKEVCHCLDDAVCDHVNGTCPGGNCAFGWEGDNCDTSTSISHGKNVSLSNASLNPNYKPEFAVDGILESKSRRANFCHCCAATAYQANPWLQVDLNGTYQIERVQVYGSDYHGGSYNNVEIYLHVNQGRWKFIRNIISNTAFINETFPNHLARYVTLLQKGSNVQLVVCELEVYGEYLN